FCAVKTKTFANFLKLFNLHNKKQLPKLPWFAKILWQFLLLKISLAHLSDGPERPKGGKSHEQV
ncbi:MAG: hypothetical protein IJV77_07160, partial [Clostridia bacterium]|nr:hypothetical protein [Clostridia bacterium]